MHLLFPQIAYRIWLDMLGLPQPAPKPAMDIQPQDPKA